MKVKNHTNKVQFNTARELQNNPNLQPNIYKSTEIKKAISFYQNKSRVQNTEKATKNWFEHFERFRKDMIETNPLDKQYTIQLHFISDISMLENQVAGFIATMKKRDGSEYKALSIRQAVDGINRYLTEYSVIKGINLRDRHQFPVLAKVLDGKMKVLQDKGFGEVNGSSALTRQNIADILSNPATSITGPDTLIKRVFFHNALLLACRGGEHYQLKINQFIIREDGGIDFQRYRAKNNQRGTMGGIAQKIPIPVDPPNFKGPCYDYKLYFEKRPIDAEQDFYLQTNPKWKKTGIWYRKEHIGRNNLSGFMKALIQKTGIEIDINSLTNHSGRKTFAQLMQDDNIEEQVIMDITGHRSVEAVRKYKVPNDQQKMDTLRHLISIQDHKSQPQIAQNTTINREINKSMHMKPLQDSQIMNHETQDLTTTFPNNYDKEKVPIFSECHFQNVNFYFNN